MDVSLMRMSFGLLLAGVVVGCSKGDGNSSRPAVAAPAAASAASAVPSPPRGGTAALVAQANAAFAAKDWAAAERALRAALAVTPNDPLLLNNLGVVLVVTKRYDEAPPLFNQALAAAEPYPVERTVLAIAAALASGNLTLLDYAYAVGTHPARPASGVPASGAATGEATSVPIKRVVEGNLQALKR